MLERLTRIIIVPTFISLIGCALWGLLLYGLWEFLIKAPSVLNDRFLTGQSNADVLRLLSTVHDDVSRVILFTTLTMFAWMFLWFVRCYFHQMKPREARALKPQWMTMGLLMIVTGLGLAYWTGWADGVLGTRMAIRTVMFGGGGGVFILIFGWWIISAVATQKAYKPSATFF